MKIQLKRSSILENGVAKEPTAGQMEYGELAINYNENDISIFTKDSDNNIRRVGGSINKGSGEPGDPGTTPGDWYFDITNGILFYWDGSGWQEVQAVGKLIAGDGIEITTATTGSTFAVDLAGGDDGLEFDSGKLKATIASESDFGVVKIGDGVIADDGVIKAKNTITVGENPPATNLKQGDLWWNSNEDNGRLYVYYEDENTQQWIDASPQGGNLEQDQADTLYLSKKNDDTAAGNITFDKDIYVKQTASIGGTTADPNIKLNADGSGEFGSGSTRIKPAYIEHASSVNSKSDLNALIGGSISGVNRFGIAFSDKLSPATLADYNFYYDIGTKELVSDGSATFAGDVIAGDYDNSEGVKVFASGWVNLKQPDGTSNNSVNLRTNIGSTRTSEITADGSRYIGGTGTTAKIKLKSDGSATFAGSVNATGGVDGAVLYATDGLGGKSEMIVARDNGTKGFIVQGTGGSNGLGSVLIGGTLPSAPNITLSANGSISSNGAHLIYRDNAEDAVINGYLNGTRTTRIAADGTAQFGGTLGGNLATNAPNISLNGSDGSATFAGDIEIGTWADNLSSKINKGAFQVRNDDTATGAYVWRAFSQGTTTGNVTSIITPDGSATFAGDIGIGGTLPSAPNIKLNADGEGAFASRVSVGSVNNGGTATTSYGLTAYNNSAGTETLFARNFGDGPLFRGRNSANDLNVEILSSGSASFAGGGFTIAPQGSITTPTIAFTPLSSYYSRVFNSGTCTLIGFTNGDLYLGGTLDGTFVNPQQPNIALNASDGSATFASLVKTGDTDFTSLSPSGYVICQNSSATSADIYFRARKNSSDIQFEVRGDGTTYIGGTNTGVPGASSPNISLNASDGSATFAGRLLQVKTTGGYRHNQNDDGLFINNDAGDASVVELRKNGTGTFTGKVTASNVTFNLEPENPDNYTTTDDVETYTGPTMDVKDTLLKVTAALALLKSSAAAATTYQELQTAIDTALADV